MQKPYIITIDKDIPMPGKPSIYECHREKLIGMQPGDSFFLPGAQPADLTGLVAYASSLGLYIFCRHAEKDDVYLAAGCRVWCESNKNLTGTKAPATNEHRYWHCPRLKSVIPKGNHGSMPAADGWVEVDEATYNALAQQYAAEKASPVRYWRKPGTNSVLKDFSLKEYEGWEEIDEATYDRLAALPANAPVDGAAEAPPVAEKTMYFHHAESGSVVIVKKGEPLLSGPDAEMCVQVDKKTYEKLKAEYEKPADPMTTYSGANGEGWYRLKTGRCVEVPAAEIPKMMKTPGATRISKGDFDSWVARQDDEL